MPHADSLRHMYDKNKIKQLLSIVNFRTMLDAFGTMRLSYLVSMILGMNTDFLHEFRPNSFTYVQISYSTRRKLGTD